MFYSKSEQLLPHVHGVNIPFDGERSSNVAVSLLQHCGSNSNKLIVKTMEGYRISRISCFQRTLQDWGGPVALAFDCVNDFIHPPSHAIV